MNRMWFQPFPMPSEVTSSWLALCPRDSWRVVSPDEIPLPAPQGLASKCDSVLVMASGSGADTVFVMANFNRKEHGLIDQMPFGFAIITGSFTPGLLVHHGDWKDRTSTGSLTPPSYLKLGPFPTASLQHYYATLILPLRESGSLAELNSATNVEAFRTVVEQVKSLYIGHEREGDEDANVPNS